MVYLRTVSFRRQFHYFVQAERNLCIIHPHGAVITGATFSLTQSLTHPPVDLPRRGLATADDHSDIFLLHCARSCDISFSWMYSQPVHSSMLCIHCLLGLPWCRSSSMIPSRTVSADCPALPRVIWLKYCSFSFATLPINSLSRPNSVNI